MKIIITGASGQLGSVMNEELCRRGHEVHAFSHDSLDITDEAAVGRAFEAAAPDAVVNCAAYNAVDRAEDEPDLCRRINVTGSVNIAEACRKAGARLMTFSSDYIFDGSGTEPFDERAVPAPLNVYGRSKSEAEERLRAIISELYIVRVSWLYGYGGRNFVNTMLRLSENAASGREDSPVLRIVSDQIGSPTFVDDLAVPLADMLESGHFGTYNLTNTGYCSWYEFAAAIFEMTGRNVNTIPVSSEEYGSRAIRPLNSRMSCKTAYSLGFGPLRGWKEALAQYLKNLRTI